MFAILPRLFGIFRHLHNDLIRAEEEQSSSSSSWGGGGGSSRPNPRHTRRLRQAVRDASSDLRLAIHDWSGDEGGEEGQLVSVIGLTWHLLEVFYFKGSVGGLLPPWPTIEWLQAFAVEEMPMDGWDTAIDMVLMGRMEEAWEVLQGLLVEEAIREPLSELLRENPWARARERARREDEVVRRGGEEEDEVLLRSNRALLSSWREWHNQAVKLATKADRGQCPVRLKTLIDVLAGDTGTAVAMVCQQNYPQWTKVLLSRILYTSPEQFLNRTTFIQHKNECQNSLRHAGVEQGNESPLDRLKDKLVADVSSRSSSGGRGYGSDEWLSM